MVEPGYERDAAPIPFAATLRRMGRDNAMEDSGGEVEIWQTQKHGINTYNLDVKPRIGTSHHDYRDILWAIPSDATSPFRATRLLSSGRRSSQGVDDL